MACTSSGESFESSVSVVVLIPCRGGSKGIPGKNLAWLAGRPLLAHTVDMALTSASVDRVIVSTEDEGIAAIARSLGAEVMNRPAELATDEASSEAALSHALDRIVEDVGAEPHRVVFLQVTSPLRGRNAIERALEVFEAEDADSLFSATRTHGFVWRRHGRELDPLTYDPATRPRRQDIGEDLIENGSIYIFKPWVLRETGNRLGGRIAVYEMDPLDSFQVDEPGDLELMEELLELRGGRCEQLDLAAIRLLVLDFDGVMTDNRVLVDQDGKETVRCDRSDGMGIEMLREAGMESVVLSKEKNPVVAARCRKLRMECIQGKDDKLPILQEMARSRGLSAEAIAYVGNDTNDLDCLRWSGVGIAVRDSHPETLGAADWVTSCGGGSGAVREVCDLLVAMLDGVKDES